MKSLFLVGISLALANFANATPVLWTLSTLSFDTGGGGPSLADGGIASGYFTYDADTNAYSDWNILVSGFGAGFSQGNALVTPLNSSVTTAYSQPTGPAYFGLSYSSDQALLWLNFPASLTNAGGSVSTNATILDAGNLFYSWYASGTATGSAVPEPAPVLFMFGGLGICVLGLFLQRRRRSRILSA
jgi:hypothetical protein